MIPDNSELLDRFINISAKRISLYAAVTGYPEVTMDYVGILEPVTAEKNIDELREEVRNDIAAFSEMMTEELVRGKRSRLERLMRNLNPVGQTFLGVAILEYLYPTLNGLWLRIGERGLNIELAAKICYSDRNPMLFHYSEMQQAVAGISKLFYINTAGNSDILRNVAAMDERLWGYILGSDAIDKMHAIAGTVKHEADTEELLVHQEQLDCLKEKNMLPGIGEHMLFHIQGKSGSGRRFLVSKCLEAEGYTEVLVNYEILKVSELAAAKKTVWYFMRESHFYDAMPVFYGLNEEILEDRDEIEGFLAMCIAPYIDDFSRIYILSTENVEIAPYTNIAVQRMSIPDLTREERILLWNTYLGQMNSKLELDINTIGSKYKLNPEQIKMAVGHIVRREKSGLTVDDRLVGDICNELLPAPSAGSIQKINAQYTFEDIKLPESQKKLLLSVCNHIWQRHKVFDTWEMDKIYSYGKGVSILFAGPPGTGKTMGAHVISNMLGLPLYRVDLSNVTSKYIGESEKKLEEIFRTAEQSNMILFFDEADSVFGKRSEVKEANDKYANTEVSYILQRMETYEGVVILATNYKKNIDDAFMRRMRYVMEFNMPDASIRYDIWKSCFTDKIPVADIDFRFLADKFELSGGNIKNIVLNSVFAAASEDQPVNMLHILEALRMEKLKSGQLMIAKDFGVYAEAMEEIIRGSV